MTCTDSGKRGFCVASKLISAHASKADRDVVLPPDEQLYGDSMIGGSEFYGQLREKLDEIELLWTAARTADLDRAMKEFGQMAKSFLRNRGLASQDLLAIPSSDDPAWLRLRRAVDRSYDDALKTEAASADMAKYR